MPSERGTKYGRPGAKIRQSPFGDGQLFYTDEEWNAEMNTFGDRQRQAKEAEAEAAITPEQREMARQKKYFDKFVLERDQQLAELEAERKKKREQEVRIAIQSAMSRRNRASGAGVGFGPFGGGGFGGTLSGLAGPASPRAFMSY